MRWVLIAFVVLSILVLGQGVMARAVLSEGRLPLFSGSPPPPTASTPSSSGRPVDSPASVGLDVGLERVLHAEDPSLPGLLMLLAGLAGLKLAGDRPWADVTRRREGQRRTERP